MEEAKYFVAQANAELSEDGELVDEFAAAIPAT